MSAAPADLHGYLAEVRARPGLFVRPGEGLQVVETMVHGYLAALHVHGLVEDGPSMHVGHFGLWLWETRGWSASAGWAHAIETHVAAPLDGFFALWDEYRALRPATVARAVPDGSDPRHPDEIELRRYLPTRLHHLRLRFGRRREDGWLLYRPDGSHRTTRADAERVAEAELGVDPRAWRVVRGR